MKKYIKPSLQVYEIEVTTTICLSDDPQAKEKLISEIDD